jgi:hypothetical protein
VETFTMEEAQAALNGKPENLVHLAGTQGD